MSFEATEPPCKKARPKTPVNEAELDQDGKLVLESNADNTLNMEEVITVKIAIRVKGICVFRQLFDWQSINVTFYCL